MPLAKVPLSSFFLRRQNVIFDRRRPRIVSVRGQRDPLCRAFGTGAGGGSKLPLDKSIAYSEGAGVRAPSDPLGLFPAAPVPRRCYVYVIRHATETDADGNPLVVYVGKGGGRRDRYWKGRNKGIQTLVDAGQTRPPVRVSDDLTEEEAYAEEMRLIARCGRKDLGDGPLLNLCDGGKLGRNPAASTRAKLSAANRKRGLGPRPGSIAANLNLSPEFRIVPSPGLAAAGDRARAAVSAVIERQRVSPRGALQTRAPPSLIHSPDSTPELPSVTMGLHGITPHEFVGFVHLHVHSAFSLREGAPPF